MFGSLAKIAGDWFNRAIRMEVVARKRKQLVERRLGLDIATILRQVVAEAERCGTQPRAGLSMQYPRYRQPEKHQSGEQYYQNAGGAAHTSGRFVAERQIVYNRPVRKLFAGMSREHLAGARGAKNAATLLPQVYPR